MTENVDSEYISLLTIEDIPEVMHICGESFPDSLRWMNGSPPGLRWWENILEIDSCVVLKFAEGEYTAGFVVLVVDLDRFNEQRQRLSSGIKDYFSMVIYSPIQTAETMLKRSKKILNARLAVNKKPGESGPRALDEKIDVDEIAWIELIAVKKDMRGRRISSKLINHCKIIASDHKKRAIFLRVDTDNLSATRVYERLGFRWIDSSVGQSTFALVL